MWGGKVAWVALPLGLVLGCADVVVGQQGTRLLQDGGLAQAPNLSQDGGAHDAGTESTEGTGEDAGLFDPSASVALVSTGSCALDFSGEMLVAGGTSLTLASFDGNQHLSTLQLDLGPHRGHLDITTAEGVRTRISINALDDAYTTWTNSSYGHSFEGKPDTIKGAIEIVVYNPETGASDVVFDDVTLENLASGSLCTLNGWVRSRRLGR